jgi:hypothetical protein
LTVFWQTINGNKIIMSSFRGNGVVIYCESCKDYTWHDVKGWFKLYHVCEHCEYIN